MFRDDAVNFSEDIIEFNNIKWAKVSTGLLKPVYETFVDSSDFDKYINDKYEGTAVLGEWRVGSG